MLSTDTDILAAARRRGGGKGRAVALANRHRTWGSRPPRSGSISSSTARAISSAPSPAVCVEGAVITEAAEVIEAGEPRLLEFGVADETAWRAGLSCGGRIRVFVKRVD